MSSATDTVEELGQRKLPAAFKELEETNNSIKPIAEYCREAYAQHDPDEVYKTTVKYTTDVLTNIAYHTHNVAQQLTTYLEAQTQAADALALQMRTIALRLAAMKEATGAQGLRRAEAVKTYQRSEKLSKLSDDQLAPHAQPLDAWKRPGQVDYNDMQSINAAMLGRK